MTTEKHTSRSRSSRGTQPHELTSLELATLLADSESPTTDPISELPREALSVLLQDLSLEPATFFGRYGRTQEELLSKVKGILPTLTGDVAIGVARAVILFGRSIEISSCLVDASPTADPKHLEELSGLVDGSRALAETLRLIYRLDEQDVFSNLDWSTLNLHQIGTTSLIFKICECPDRHGEEAVFALKLNHVLFTSVGPIAAASRNYHRDWSHLHRGCPWLVKVKASGVGWVLEEFISGVTLRQYLDRELKKVSTLEGRLDLFENTYTLVLDGLSHLHDLGVGHGDLNPSNIILQERNKANAGIVSRNPSSQFVARFIDMGRNLLAASTVGRVRAADSAFVAPEVIKQPVEEKEVAPSADYYSLGQLLVTCLGYAGHEGFYQLPERAYAEQPQLIRHASRLVHENPEARVAYVDTLDGESGSEPRLYRLSDKLLAAVEVLRNIERGPLGQEGSTASAQIKLLLESIVGALNTGFQSFRLLSSMVKKRQARTGYDTITASRLVVATLGYAFGVFLLVYSALIDTSNDPLPLFTRVFESLGYKGEHPYVNWQIRIVAASFLVAAFQYTSRVFGGITFWYTNAARWTRTTSELTLWLMTVVVPILLCFTLFGKPALWPLCTALGLVVVNANNFITMIARRQVINGILREPARVSWYERSAMIQNQRYDLLSYWAPTLVTFTGTVFGLAITLLLHVAHDAMIYACMLAAINIFIFSYSEATKQGPLLRGNLAQYVVAGENIRHAPAEPTGSTRLNLVDTAGVTS